MTTALPDLVYGERRSDLVPAFEALVDSAQVEDEMVRYSVRLAPSVGDPFFRALMRAEAELLCEDAHALGTPEYESRTAEQRGVDALVRLAEAFGGGSASQPESAGP